MPIMFDFTVEGSGEFPFDMLRYASCWPKTERHDSGQLSQFCTHHRRIVLETCDEPIPERWASFGWRYIGPGELRDQSQFPTPEVK